jgi:hypothetical protein
MLFLLISLSIIFSLSSCSCSVLVFRFPVSSNFFCVLVNFPVHRCNLLIYLSEHVPYLFHFFVVVCLCPAHCTCLSLSADVSVIAQWLWVYRSREGDLADSTPREKNPLSPAWLLLILDLTGFPCFSSTHCICYNHYPHYPRCWLFLTRNLLQ